jgi:phenylpyruvate tautomerase PptA (4-oxalocrotonate tautomerase family)
MPIVTVEIVGGDDAAAAIACGLAARLGEALAAPAGSLWVQVRNVAVSDYAENGPAPQPPPVFVRVLARADTSATAQRAGAIAAAVAQVVGRPRERVHVICEPDASGRVFFGGAPDPR